MKIQIKKINLIPAIEILMKFRVLYNIEEGICFGKDVYWIDIHSDSYDEDVLINAIRAVGYLGEDSEEVHGVHIDDVAHDVINRVIKWRQDWKSNNQNSPEEWPLEVSSDNSGILYESICVLISE